MPRRKKQRFIEQVPVSGYYKPNGIRLRDLREVLMPVEELEVLRLIDFEKLSQAEVAEKMGVSRPTISRVLDSARGHVASALCQGFALRIEGGDFSQVDFLKDKNMKEIKKIAISAKGSDLQSDVDPLFGRAAGFLIVELETMQFEYVDNADVAMGGGGAGIRAVEKVAQYGVDAVLSGSFGPNAVDALNAAGIAYYDGFAQGSVESAIKDFQENSK